MIRGRASRLRFLSTQLLALALASVPVAAAIPSASKIADAVAEANAGSGRAKPLLLEVEVRIADQSVRTGRLATHPTGLARLELRGPQGSVERHLLQGDSYTASRDGVMIEQPLPLLPPFFLLQATSGAALGAALVSYGVPEHVVVLGRLDDHDCYVFGGRLPRSRHGPETLLPSMWVDIKSYDPVRIVRADGVMYRLGPVAVYDGIRVPRWIEIEMPGGSTARLEIQRVAPANAPAAAFGTDWLTAPTSIP